MPGDAPLGETTFDDQQVNQAYSVMRGGGLILAKLDIGYGFVGCSDDAIQRMYQLKGRRESNPCVVPGNFDVLGKLCPRIDTKVLAWLRHQAEWTTLSVIGDLDEASTLWRSLPDFVRKQSSYNGSVAVFIRPGAFLEALVARGLDDNQLLAGSSGNLSGQGNSFRPEELAPSIIEGVDLFINHGVAKHANTERRATTMIDLRSLEITRVGVNHAGLKDNLDRLRSTLT